MASNGYIKIDRKILDSAIWQEKPFDRARAWIDLLLLASWKDHEEIYRGKAIFRKRGEVSCSIGWLAERWGWSANKVRRYIRTLNRLGMCTQNGTPNGTTLTIENYALYQDGRRTNGRGNGTTDGTPNESTDGTHHKKGKEGKRIDNNARVRAGGGNPYFALLESGVFDDDEK